MRLADEAGSKVEAEDVQIDKPSGADVGHTAGCVDKCTSVPDDRDLQPDLPSRTDQDVE